MASLDGIKLLDEVGLSLPKTLPISPLDLRSGPSYSFVLNTSHGTLNQDTLNFPQNPFIPT